jgi:hypothetical protein
VWIVPAVNYTCTAGCLFCNRQLHELGGHDRENLLDAAFGEGVPVHRFL